MVAIFGLWRRGVGFLDADDDRHLVPHVAGEAQRSVDRRSHPVRSLFRWGSCSAVEADCRWVMMVTNESRVKEKQMIQTTRCFPSCLRRSDILIDKTRETRTHIHHVQSVNAHFACDVCVVSQRC